MKWSPWPSGATRRFHVKVNQLKLQGFNFHEKVGVVVIEVKWKGSKPGGPEALFPFYGRRSSSRKQKDYTNHRSFLSNRHDEVIEWDDEFHSLCNFGLKQGGSFSPWDLTFTILHGERAESKNNMVVLGKVTMNLAEMASRMESRIQRKLSVSLKMEGMATREATLLICLSFEEVRNSHDSAGMGPDSGESDKDRLIRGVSYFRSFRKTNIERKGQRDRVMTSTSDWDEPFCSDSEGLPRNALIFNGVNVGLNSKAELGSSRSHETRFDSGQRSWFLRKRKWLSGSRPPRRKVEPFAEKTSGGVNAVQIAVDNHSSDSIQKSDTAEYSSQSHQEHGNCMTSSWEEREVASRDGQAKLKTNVFFASFDQRSEKAAGESACTALVAVIAHWLHSNRDSMPTRSEFDSLITEGSSEWQKLCSNETCINLFPNRHFDLETVLEAKVRPLDVSADNSFIGFFSPEKFECLKGLMSFDDIWKEINEKTMSYEPRIYIVSWNDHFFVLKAEADAYYIIDSLGERLFEGCNQAYILKFNDSSIMFGKAEKAEADSEETVGSESNEEESLEVICSGKECCRQFIKRFLAAIPLGELEEEEKKRAVSILPLHQRLQIDFHYTSSPSSMSSSATSSTYSLFSGEESV